MRQVPPSARGMAATSEFWTLTGADQDRFRSGWWAAYNRRPPTGREKPVWTRGWVEGHQMLFDMGTPPGPYRYTLSRKLGGSKGVALFCMLNPSTADDTKNDPTIRRCIGFATSWGCSELRVVNLFSARATKPKALRDVRDPVGHGNDDIIRNEIGKASLLVAAWGATGGFLPRKRAFLQTFGEHEWMCLGHTREGHPLHPLYVPKDRGLERFRKEAFLPTEQ